jgi:hypothetical protein
LPEAFVLIDLPSKRFQPKRYRPGDLGNWSGHLPFANDLIAALRPSLLVELGTHYGESYFGFCQAIAENAVPCKCFAIDTWQGDSHAGYYDESVFQEVQLYNSTNYASFSTLLRDTFDRASEQFGAETIDLLHIDGLHLYQAVKHDFENWFPKVRPGGIILFHDTNARHADFNVWRFWEEISQRYSGFEFTHSWGLGVLYKPASSSNPPDLVRSLFSGTAAERAFLQHYYSTLAEALAWEQRVRFVPTGRSFTRLQVFPCLRGGYEEGTSVAVTLELDRWETHSINLSQGSGCGRIRIDPTDAPGLVEIRAMLLRRNIDKAVLKSWTTPDEILSCSFDDELIIAAGDPPILLSAGPDPKFFLPEDDNVLLDQPLIVEISLRVSSKIGPAIEALLSTAQLPSNTPAVAEKSDRAPARTRLESLRQELDFVGREKDNMAKEREQAILTARSLELEVRSLQTERLAAMVECKRAFGAQHALLAQLDDSRRALEKEQDNRIKLEQGFTAYRSSNEQELNSLQTAVESERRGRAEILKSYSWRITAPVRRLYDLLLAVRS